jgi:hypothetical protein
MRRVKSHSVPIEQLPEFVREHYECLEWRHACAVLATDFPGEWDDIMNVLSAFRLRKSHIAIGGGRKSDVAGSLDQAFLNKGWSERHFKTRIQVDENTYESPTHKVDCYKNGVGLEIEWNNKDPFFDRDLNNFRLLFELRALAVGIVVTRCDHLQEIFDGLGRGSSYGASTTHMSKLRPRLEGGAGGGCPILVFGISRLLYDPNS